MRTGTDAVTSRRHILSRNHGISHEVYSTCNGGIKVNGYRSDSKIYAKHNISRTLTSGALQVLQKHSRSGLAWNRPCADCGLSRPTSVFRTTIGVCQILSRSVEIWEYNGQKHVLE